jgi:hypothetical protein
MVLHIYCELLLELQLPAGGDLVIADLTSDLVQLNAATDINHLNQF